MNEIHRRARKNSGTEVPHIASSDPGRENMKVAELPADGREIPALDNCPARGQLPGHSASRARPHAFTEPGRMPAARACWSGRDQVQGRHGAQGHDEWHVQPLRVAAQLLRCRIAGLIREQMFSGPSFRRSAANALHRVRLSESLAHRTADQSRCPRNRLESRWRLRQTMFNAPVERAPSGVVGNWRTMK